MMRVIHSRCGPILSLLFTLWLYAQPVTAQTEEKLLEEINQLPEAERQARLIAGAKKEGAVTWYVAMNRTFAQDLINGFEAQYPFVKVNALTQQFKASNRIEYRRYRSDCHVVVEWVSVSELSP